jgi:hypothetical protein
MKSRIKDKRYKEGVDSGVMSTQTILPLKPAIAKPVVIDDIPKQYIRQEQAKLKNRLIKRKIRKIS